MIILHNYWRSSAAYRVRIGLHLKDLAFTPVAVNLLAGEQSGEAYRALNPQGLVPFLQDGETALAQSLAILEWLDETYPHRPLLPPKPTARAVVRSMAQLLACEVNPLGNLRVLNRLRSDFAATDEQVAAWVRHWLSAGLSALETMLEAHAGAYCFGDLPGLADCVLIPVGYGADRWGLDLGPFPNAARIIDHARRDPAFVAAHPDNQPDTPKPA